MNVIEAKVRFFVNRSDTADVERHLRACDTAFVPHLSARVEVCEYARKLVERAVRFEAWADDRIVGLVAAYCDDAASGAAFITNVSVEPDHQRQGIASDLVDRCVAHVRGLGFARVDLEVDERSSKAVALYRDKGFAVDTVDAGTVAMHLDLRTRERSAP